MSQHRHDHEELIQAVLAGDLGEDDPVLHKVLDECSHCREQFEGLARVRTLLDDTARDERDTLENLDWSGPAPGRELVGAYVRGQLASRPARPWWQTPWVAAAAAGILIGGWIVRWLMPAEPTNSAPVTLGAHTSGGYFPNDTRQGYAHFEWPLQLPPGGSFRLRIWDDRPDSAKDLVADVNVDTPFWNPKEADTASWPERISWQVTPIDAFKTSLPTSPLIRASR